MAPLASFATAPILAHALGVVQRGELAAATAPFLFASIAATVGIPEAITYFTASGKGGGRLVVRALPMFTLVSILAAGMLFVLAPVIASGDASVALFIRVSGISLLPTALLAALRGSAAGNGNWAAVRNERIIGAAARLAPILIFAWAGSLSVTIAALVVVFSPLCGALAFVRLPRYNRGVSPVDARMLVGYGGRVWIGSLSGILLSRLDQVIMNPIAGSKVLGLYVVAVNIAEVLLIVMTTVTSTTFTADARLRDDASLARTARISLIVMSIAALVLSVSLPLWVTPFFGADFADAIPVCWILIFAYAVTAPGVIAGTALGARGRPGLSSATLMMAVFANCISLVLLVPPFGAIGAAIATLFGNGTAAVLNLFLLRKFLSVDTRRFAGIYRSDVRYSLSVVKKISSKFTGS